MQRGYEMFSGAGPCSGWAAWPGMRFRRLSKRARDSFSLGDGSARLEKKRLEAVPGGAGCWGLVVDLLWAMCSEASCSGVLGRVPGSPVLDRQIWRGALPCRQTRTSPSLPQPPEFAPFALSAGSSCKHRICREIADHPKQSFVLDFAGG